MSQSASVVQPAKVADGPQNCSMGPAAHLPSFPTAQLPAGHSEPNAQLAPAFDPPTQVLVGLQSASSHSLGLVGIPANEHAPPGHWLVEVHGAPLLVPLMQRWPVAPPQIPWRVLHRPAVHAPLAHC